MYNSKLTSVFLALVIVGVYMLITKILDNVKIVKPKNMLFYSNIQKVGDYNILITRGILSSVDRQTPTRHFYDAHFWVKDRVVAKNHVERFDKYPVGTKLTEEEINLILQNKV
jgi:hypothetical protein|tara:strand:- start:38 stop:376 length:339 start_codon:yes stop_codon:yes gene_type:complete